MNPAVMDMALEAQHTAMDAIFLSDRPNQESKEEERSITRIASRKHKEKETLRHVLKLGASWKPKSVRSTTSSLNGLK